MILHPAVIALLLSSFLTALLVVVAAWHGGRVLRHWDLASGSSQQLDLERRTYLVSTALAAVFGFELVSLFLLVYTAENIHGLFTGAMCAAGTFNAHPLGYPLLLLKSANFLLAGMWLVLNHADNRAYDYPLIRKKYAFLLALSPFLIAETVLQVRYFAGLHPDVITSCCGSLFSTRSASISSDIAALPAGPMRPAFFAAVLAVVVLGCRFALTGKGGMWSVLSAGILLPISLAAILSFIAPAVYELPTHHCPFCLLKKEYWSVGYLFHALIFGGAAAGLAVGVLMPFRSIPSLQGVVPALQRRYALLSVLCAVLLGGLAIASLLVSNLRQ